MVSRARFSYLASASTANLSGSPSPTQVPRANNYSTPRLAEKQKTELSKPPDIPEDETVRVSKNDTDLYDAQDLSARHREHRRLRGGELEERVVELAAGRRRSRPRDARGGATAVGRIDQTQGRAAKAARCAAGRPDGRARRLREEGPRPVQPAMIHGYFEVHRLACTISVKKLPVV